MVKESKVIVFDDYHLEGVMRVLKEHVKPHYNIEYIPFKEGFRDNRASAIVRTDK